MTFPILHDYLTNIPGPPPWLIDGLVRQRQITALGAAFNTGKSPLLIDLAIHTINGLKWCGRQCEKRPVIYFDFETPDAIFRHNIANLCKSRNLPHPRVADDLIPILRHGEKSNPYTVMLKEARGNTRRVELLRALLRHHPTALVICDPLQLFLRVDTNKQVDIENLYESLYDGPLAEFPQAGLIGSFNLRKPARNIEVPDLLTAPHDWLNEITGNMAVMNRCDIRVGLERSSSIGALILNGAVRGSDFAPLIVKAVPFGEGYAGFAQVIPDSLTASMAFTDKQFQQWKSLPSTFRYSDVVPKLIPKSSFSNLWHRAKSLGILELNDGVYSRPAPNLDPQPTNM